MDPTQRFDVGPWQRLESTLMATSRAVRRAFDVALEEVSLNLTQGMVLAYVEQFGPLTQTQLADRVGIGRAATGTIIDAMHERGLVRRDTDPNDRRVWRITLTRQGKEIAARVVEIDTKLRSELRAGLRRDERQQLVQQLVRLQQNALAALGEDDSEKEQ
jgi:DNA-binding MarR family transcriptional regulator